MSTYHGTIEVNKEKEEDDLQASWFRDWSES